MWHQITYGLACAAAISLSSLYTSNAWADTLDGERVAMIDAHALAAASPAEDAPDTLVRYLEEPTRDDTEKARAIFRWVTDRISYDVDAYFSNNLANMNAEDVLRERRSICDGYATLFEKLGREAGLEVVTIKGYAKAYGHTPGTRFDRPNHAWNAVKINGQWKLVDSTWGAGYVSNGKYVKVLTETFFLAPPEQFIFSHLPVDDRWQLQSTPHLTKAQFEALPDMEPSFFHLGIPGEDVWHEMTSPEFSGTFVHTFDMPYHLAVVQHAPLSYRLHADQQQQFMIQSGAFEKMAIVQNNKWKPLNKTDGVFTTSITPFEQGEMMVVGKKPGMENYTTILDYQVVQ